MKNTTIIYITMGILFIVPWIVTNIKKIWVRVPPNSVQFKPGRCVFVTVITAVIVCFLLTAYNATLTNRSEITIERLAVQHAKVLVGKQSIDEFRSFVSDNGTENVAASFDTTTFSSVNNIDLVRFQISDPYIPKYWKDKEGFDQTAVIDSDNPVYVMYLLDINGVNEYYVARLLNTEDGWKFDWFGNANDVQKKAINMPTKINGKWFTVKK